LAVHQRLMDLPKAAERFESNVIITVHHAFIYQFKGHVKLTSTTHKT
jgi:hypothetical protein